jgi:hypothetical protein
MKLNLRQILHKPGLLVLLGLLLIIAVAGALLVKINTPFGLGMDPDSGLYIMGARNLLAANGYSGLSRSNLLCIPVFWHSSVWPVSMPFGRHVF